MKTKLLIINGKFSRDGKEEKPEFGNVEHIEALQKAGIREKELTEGMDIDVEYEETSDVDDDISSYDALVRFKCVCGSHVQFIENVESEGDTDELEKTFIPCHICKRKYKSETNENYDLIITLQ